MADVIAEGWTCEQLRAWFARDGGRFIYVTPIDRRGAGRNRPPSGQSAVPATTLPSESPRPEATTAAERRAAELRHPAAGGNDGAGYARHVQRRAPCNEDSAPESSAITPRCSSSR